MDSETSLLKWGAAALGVVLVCFCLGYYVLGPSTHSSGPAPTDVAAVPSPTASDLMASPPANGGMIVDEKTDAIAAEQKQIADAAKKKADAETAKKAAADAKALAEEKAAEAAAAANPSPSPGGDTGNSEVGGTGAPIPAATPATADNGNSAPNNPPVDVPTPAATVYRVRVGTFATRDSAKGEATELNGRGYTAVIISEKSGDKIVFRLQVGAYHEKKTADGIQQELKANGYDATVN